MTTWALTADNVEPKPAFSQRKLLMLLCCAGAPFMIMLDTNIVAVSLPAIARDLHGEFTDVEWVVSAYVLPFLALLIPAGALADRHGRRRILSLGLVIFTFASLLCGLAPTLQILNGARALQAVGAALQLSASLAVIAHGFEAHERTRVYAIWGTVMGIAPSLGPVLGGLITSYLGWRWAFFINLPIGVVLIALATTTVEESRDPNAKELDLWGIFLFGAAMFGIVWALIAANSVGWTSPSTLIKLGFGTVFLILFIFVERRHSRPMIDLALFRNSSFIGATIAMLGYAASAQVLMTLLPLYLQDAYGRSAAMTGLAMIPFALPLLFGPSVGGKLAARLTSRAILSFGLGLAALGDLVIAASIYADRGYWPTAVGMVITGFGAGILNSETAKAQVSAVSPDRAGMASGIASATRFVGIIFGLAGLGAVIASTAEDCLRTLGISLKSSRQVDWHSLNLRIVGGDANAALAALPSDFRDKIMPAIHESVTIGFGAAVATAVVIAIASCALSWFLVRGPATLTSEEQHQS